MQSNEELARYIADATGYLKGSFRYTKVFLRACRVLDVLNVGREMDSAPTDGTTILLQTSDFGWVEGFWNVHVANFYKSQACCACYDPDNAQGDWCAVMPLNREGGDQRLYCGFTPQRWLPCAEKWIDPDWAWSGDGD
ncbi:MULTISPECIES: hypothetical protein [Thalassospira]|uniref:Uncharacterized protein n=1 Tax=Thalassospira xiamenensis TaxID=220697 RepID=A0ABR5XWJ0_9PROT|nr:MULTISPECIES: hypothetical protein [Thalassospira]KZC97189.1 hypothetical protein AUP40_04430 [Thalassospira xiamenensis]KZD10218.1 hypothetical protein AUP45_02780 [Thalassospira xiamenensis]MCD1593134.1 hypothetical protein [Thalassospira xiamenensis]MDM7975216.1 hypothetical protein [Thalassospira xiamenensis]OHZ00999.1 hypothetical protein BC440_09180 [Thalassospira sp. MIT1004]